MPRGFKPKRTTKGSKKKTSHRNTIVAVVSIVTFILAFSGIILFPRTGGNTVYESNLIVTGSIGENITSPNFGVKSGQRITVKITNFQSNNVTLKVDIQGGGNFWHKIFSDSSSFSKIAPNESVYNVQFAVNTFYDIGGEISFHVVIYLVG